MALVKLNIAYPEYGSQKMLEIDDEKKIRPFLDKRIAEEVPADALGDDFKGYTFKITGGYDKDGFAMMQGVMLNHRTRLVLDGSTGMYRPKRPGARKRKSVRGCIIGNDLSMINLVITKRGPQNLPGLTDPDSDRPSMRGPKRANNIRKLWGLSKEDDVRQFVSRKRVPGKNGKKDSFKSPKIQRLITPKLLQRKRRFLALKKRRFEKNQKQASEYAKLLAQMRKEKRAAILSKKRKQNPSTTKSTNASASEKAKVEATPTPAQGLPKASGPSKPVPKAATPKELAGAKKVPITAGQKGGKPPKQVQADKPAGTAPAAKGPSGPNAAAGQPKVKPPSAGTATSVQKAAAPGTKDTKKTKAPAQTSKQQPQQKKPKKDKQ